MQILEKRLNEIEPYSRNPRKNDAAVGPVMESIKQFGFKVPIVIDRNGVIVTGHTRYKAARKLHLKTVPCICADDLTEEQIKAFRLADNKVGELAEWDFELLGKELDALGDYDMDVFGFDVGGQEEQEPTAHEDDFETPLPAEPKAKRGQIYKLGNHRLMCGDSTSAEDVKRLLDGAEIDLVITDPPYNVDYTGKQDSAMKIDNDNMAADTFQEFLTDAFKNMAEALRPGGAFYIWHASRTQRQFENALNINGLEVRQQLIWNKNTMVLGRQDYQWKHEPCFYGWKEGAPHYFIDNRALCTVQELEDKEKFKDMKKEELVALLEKIYTEDITPATIINEKKPARSDMHPTMKPILLLARAVKNSSKMGECILDLFGGSGSTLIACEELKRVNYTMEYDPRYIDVIIERWEKLTGKKAELLEE